MDRNLEFLNLEGLGLVGWEMPNIVGQRNRLGYDALGVVISFQKENRNSRSIQSAHLAVEEQPDGSVLPLTVIHVAGDNDKGNLELNRLGYEVGKCFTTCKRKPLGNVRVFQAQSDKWATQMQIGGVKESEVHRSVHGVFVSSRINTVGRQKKNCTSVAKRWFDLFDCATNGRWHTNSFWAIYRHQDPPENRFEVLELEALRKPVDTIGEIF